MADRVNTKFVVILITVLVALTSVVVMGVMMIQPGVTQRLERGDQYLSQGKIKKAIEQYGLALKKEQSNPAIMLKYLDAVDLVKTDDSRDAEKYLKSQLSFLSELITQDPSNTEHFERFVRLYMRIGSELGDPGVWDQILERCEKLLRNHPDRRQARKYRGIAQVNRLGRYDLSPQERQLAREDLEDALSRNPQDRELLFYLTQWHVWEARLVDQPGVDPELPRHHRSEAERIAKKSLEMEPEDLQRQIDLLSTWLSLKKSSEQQAKQLANQIEQRILEDPSDIKLVIQCANAMRLVQDIDSDESIEGQLQQATAGLERSEQILLAGLQTHPDDRSLMMGLGQNLQLQRRPDEAAQMYKRAYELEIEADVFSTYKARSMQFSAALQCVDLLLAKADRGEADQRQQTLADAESLVQEIAAGENDNGAIELRLGRIAVMRGDLQEASAKLERANRLLGDRNPTSLFLSAKVWQRLGQPGAAIERFEKLLQIYPQHPSARYELVRMYLGLRDFDKADQLLASLLESNPRDLRAIRYKAQSLAMNGQADTAIEILERLDPQQNTELIPQLASLYVASGQRQRATDLLEERFQQDPADINVLLPLLRIVGSDDPDQAAAYIQTAREAGGSAEALETLDRYVESGSDQSELFEELLDQQQDPVRRFRMLQRMGRLDEARAILSEAIQQDPESPAVIEAQFELAMLDKDWEKAENLADQAATMNIDQAEGMFYYGRLAARQGDYQRAIDSYRRGLDLRPIFSDGWRLLADAQVKATLLEDAAESYQRAIEYRPNDVASLRGIAGVWGKLGRHDRALETLRKAVAFSPRNRQLRAQYLRYEGSEGDVRKALEHARAAFQSDPKDATNRRNLALLLANAGQLDEAKRTIEPLIQDDSADRESISLMARIYASSGDPEAGRKLLQDYVNGLGDEASEKDWLTLAQYMMSIGLEGQAAAAFRKAVAVEDTDTRLASRTFADLLFKRRQFDEAAQRYADLWNVHPDEPALGLRYVDSLYKAGQWDQAKEILEKVTNRHGENETTLLLNAAIAQGEGYDALAVQSLDRAVKMAPRRANLYFRRAELRFPDLSQEPVVVDDLNRALELDPDLFPAQWLMAELFYRRGETREAISVLRTVLERDPTNNLVRRRLVQLYQEADQPESLRLLLDESAQIFPQEAYWVSLQAQQALAQGDGHTALEKFHQAFELDPTPLNLIKLTDTQIQAGQAQEALAWLGRYQELVLKDPLLKAMRGLALVKTNALEQAEAAFADALNSCQTLNQIVLIREQMVAVLGPEKTQNFLLQQAQESPYGLIELALAELQLTQKDYQLSRWWLDRVSSKIDDSSSLKLDYDRIAVLLLYYEGRYDETLAAYQKALDEHPNDLMILNNAADFLTENLDQPQEALPLVKRAVDIAPNNPLVLDTLGWTLFKNGQVESGLAALRRSARLRPTAVNSFHLAEVLLHRGESENAELLYNQAQQLAQQSNDQRVLLAANQRLKELIQGSEEFQ